MRLRNRNPRFQSLVALRFVAAASCLLSLACGRSSPSSLQEAWDWRNRPEIFSADYQKKFAQLPLKGTSIKPWSDSYWPSRAAGIASRWNGSWPDDQFTFPLLTKEEIKQKSLRELAALSPAEKYDIFVGNEDYPMVHHERSRTSPNRPGWEGLCHGWAPASVNFKEPNPVIVENDEGIKVPFGSSDIKGLLALLQGNYYTGRTRFLGGRCNQNISAHPERALDPECKDVNAGTFHLVLTNEIGIREKPFMMDVTRDFEVWNHPVFQYQSRVVTEQEPSREAAPGTVKEVIVATDVTYGAETFPQWERLEDEDSNVKLYVSYQYRLELDQEGEIIGGEWLDLPRPDFLWAQDPAEFVGIFSKLKKIYDASLAAAPGLKNPAFESEPSSDAASSTSTESGPSTTDSTGVSSGSNEATTSSESPMIPPVITVAP